MRKIILLVSLMYLSLFCGTAQKNDNLNINKETITVKTKTEAHPDVYIDGEKYNKHILDLIDPTKIESVSVIKGKEALKKYNSTEGVIVVCTKKEEQSVKIENNDSTNTFRIKGTTEKNPLFLIDGKEADAETIKNYNPKDVKKIQVLKDESATAIYGARGANGVILLTTKSAANPKPFSER